MIRCRRWRVRLGACKINLSPPIILYYMYCSFLGDLLLWFHLFYVFPPRFLEWEFLSDCDFSWLLPAYTLNTKFHWWKVACRDQIGIDNQLIYLNLIAFRQIEPIFFIFEKSLDTGTRHWIWQQELSHDSTLDCIWLFQQLWPTQLVIQIIRLINPNIRQNKSCRRTAHSTASDLCQT